MSFPKRHHYLPISYLDGFARDRMLWVFDRVKDEFRQQTPLNTGLEKHLNTYTDEFGEKKTIESELAEIEGATKSIIFSLNQRQKIKEPEREVLSQFVALLWMRVPIYNK